MTELLKFQNVVNDLLYIETAALSEKHFVLVILNRELSHMIRNINIKSDQLRRFCQQTSEAIHNHLRRHALHPYISKRRLNTLIKDPEAFIRRWQHLNFNNILGQYFQRTNISMTPHY